VLERNLLPAPSLYWPFGVSVPKRERVNSHVRNLLSACLTLKEQRKGKVRAIIDPLFLERIS
jgi:hypothetical protein